MFFLEANTTFWAGFIAGVISGGVGALWVYWLFHVVLKTEAPPLIEYEIRVKRIKKMYHDELKKRLQNDIGL
jgi:uncharacterized membrane protein YdjX (TVP38/TMEM64 family)